MNGLRIETVIEKREEFKRCAHELCDLLPPQAKKLSGKIVMAFKKMYDSNAEMPVKVKAQVFFDSMELKFFKIEPLKVEQITLFSEHLYGT